MFRFSIRELLLATATLALIVAWWLDHSKLKAAAFKAESLERMLQRVVNLHAEETGDSFEVNDGRYSYCSWRSVRELIDGADDHPHVNTTRFRNKDVRKHIDSRVMAEPNSPAGS
jgi:hypothetical protein